MVSPPRHCVTQTDFIVDVNDIVMFMHECQTVIVTLPAQVDNRVQSLSEHYDGPQPSDLCVLLEGEQFFAGFERGLDISTGLKSSLKL